MRRFHEVHRPLPVRRADLIGVIVRVEPSGVEFDVAGDETLMAAAGRAGYRWPTVCGGLADCGVCVVDVMARPAGGLAPPADLEARRLAVIPAVAPTGRRAAPRLPAAGGGAGLVVHKRGVRPVTEQGGDDRTDDSPIPDYPSLLRLDGRRIIVVGAGNGIGREALRTLSMVGARLCCVDVDADLAAQVAEEVGGVAAVGDMRTRTDAERVFGEATAAALGLDGVVGIIGTSHWATPSTSRRRLGRAARSQFALRVPRHAARARGRWPGAGGRWCSSRR